MQSTHETTRLNSFRHGTNPMKATVGGGHIGEYSGGGGGGYRPMILILTTIRIPQARCRRTWRLWTISTHHQMTQRRDHPRD